jgi:hypothetical protein
LVPKRLLEWLFKGGGSRLHYRFPHSNLEQMIRKISHFYLFRPPMGKNINFIKKIAKDDDYELYIVSSRYSFLKRETEIWLEKRNLEKLFKKIYLNEKNEQPHLFKEKVLKEIKPDIFIDDDEAIVDYLCQKTKTHIYCFSLKKVTPKPETNLFLSSLELLFR